MTLERGREGGCFAPPLCPPHVRWGSRVASGRLSAVRLRSLSLFLSFSSVCAWHRPLPLSLCADGLPRCLDTDRRRHRHVVHAPVRCVDRRLNRCTHAYTQTYTDKQTTPKGPGRRMGVRGLSFPKALKAPHTALCARSRFKPCGWMSGAALFPSLLPSLSCESYESRFVGPYHFSLFFLFSLSLRVSFVVPLPPPCRRSSATRSTARGVRGAGCYPFASSVL